MRGACLLLALLSAPLRADPIMLRSDDWCPMTCNADAPAPGFLVEIATRALKSRGHEVRYEVMNWARIKRDSPTTPDKEALLGVARTPSRLALYAFPDIPQVVSPTCFYADKPISWRYRGTASLPEVTVGVINGSSYGPSMDAYLADRSNRKRISAAAGEHAAQANLRKLTLGRVDVVLESRLVARYLSRNRLGTSPLHELGCLKDAEPSLYIAFNKRHPDAQTWADAVGAETRRLRASGELERLLKAYGLQDWETQGRPAGR